MVKGPYARPLGKCFDPTIFINALLQPINPCLAQQFCLPRTKKKGKIKELSQMTLVSCMNTNFQSKNDSARCGVTDFGGKMPWRSCFFFTIML